MLELHAGGYTAWIAPERGGACLRLSRWGAEALCTPKTEEELAQTPFFFGTPLLFPPNRISGAEFTFQGRRYSFPVNEPATGCFLHGELYKTPFQVLSQGEGGVRLGYRATVEQPYLSFPHAFSLTLDWSLSPDGLRQETSFTNLSDADMPVALGFHTAFRAPFAPEGRAEDIFLTLDTQREYGRNMRNYLPDGSVFTEYPDRQALAQGAYQPCDQAVSRLFQMGARHEMRLTDRKRGLAVRYRAGESFRYWMVYHGGPGKALCVEPQSWLSNCPNAPFPREKTGFDSIAPGETRRYETWLSIERTEA